MNYDHIFIEKVENPLSKLELLENFKKISLGDKSAREKIINHNIKLVINRVFKKFSNTPYEKKELVSVGLIGLIKSVDSFDINKKIEFSSYCIKCIDNEILLFIRRQKKFTFNQSLNQTIGKDKDEKKLTIESLLAADVDVMQEYEEKELRIIINHIVKQLQERDKEIIMMRYGFINDKIYTQQEVANKLGISRGYVSILELNILKKIKTILDDEIKLSNRLVKLYNKKI